MFRGKVIMQVDAVDGIIKSIHRMVGKRVVVGVLHDERTDGSDIGNAAIGYLNEHGAPEMNIPPRPHLSLGVRAVQYSWMGHLRWAGVEATEGHDPEEQLRRAGEVARDGIRHYIEQGLYPPLRDVTIKHRHAAGGMPVSTLPLLHTRAYINAIDYEVRDAPG